MVGKLTDKVALITGGANGIGAATAALFGREGATVIVADRDIQAGEAMARTSPLLQFRKMDVSREDEVAAGVDFAVQSFGHLDVMINNAGMIGAVGPISQLSREAWESTIAVLLDGVFFGMKHAARVMIPRKSGCILSTSSIAGLAGGLGAHAYTAAKHAVGGLVKSVATELASHGITVNAVAPGATVSALSRELMGGVEQANWHAARNSPLGQPIVSEDIAEAFLFLACPSGRNVSGQTLVIDGGFLAGGGGRGVSRFHEADSGFLGRGPDPVARG